MAKIIQDENLNNPGTTTYNEDGTSTFSKTLKNPQGLTIDEMIKAGNAGMGTVASPQQNLANAVDMVSLTNKAGQNVSVSKKDWETNPYYKSSDWQMVPEKGAGGIEGFLTDWMTKKQDEIVAPTMSDEKLRLEASRKAQLSALDEQYAVELAKVQRMNKDAGNALKARLLKLGVSPSDSAWSNAEVGQMERDAAAEAKLRSEYLSNKARVEADIDAKISNIAMQENQMAFQAQVQNMNNWLTKVGQGLDLFTIFENRNQAEKDREQRAYGDLMNYTSQMATLDQQKQMQVAKTIAENAQQGMYNVADPETAKMLSDMQSKYPDFLNGILGVATEGLSNRLLDKAQKELELKKTEAETRAVERSNRGGGGGTQTTPKEEVDPFQADIDYATDMIIRAENAGGGSAETYWNMVSKISESSGLSQSDIDAILIGNINRRKGITSPQVESSEFISEQPYKPEAWKNFNEIFGGSQMGKQSLGAIKTSTPITIK